MKVYEVFLKKPGKEPFEHAGSLEAPNDDLALLLAREAYVRRGEGAAMWLVARDHLLVGEPELLELNNDKPHRRNDGSVVATHRRATRQQQ